MHLARYQLANETFMPLQVLTKKTAPFKPFYIICERYVCNVSKGREKNCTKCDASGTFCGKLILARDAKVDFGPFS